MSLHVTGSIDSTKLRDPSLPSKSCFAGHFLLDAAIDACSSYLSRYPLLEQLLLRWYPQHISAWQRESLLHGRIAPSAAGFSLTPGQGCCSPPDFMRGTSPRSRLRDVLRPTRRASTSSLPQFLTRCVFARPSIPRAYAAETKPIFMTGAEQ